MSAEHQCFAQVLLHHLHGRRHSDRPEQGLWLSLERLPKALLVLCKSGIVGDDIDLLALIGMLYVRSRVRLVFLHDRKFVSVEVKYRL